jgi:hypothetical protein
MDLKEFGNSINKILNERLTSPFYGTLIVSWLIINWKIVYFTLFVGSNEIDGTKLDYIIKNYSESSNVFWYPILVTILLITVFPFITYLAYWANLYFTDLRKNRKNKVEENMLMTRKESNDIRRKTLEIENDFNKLLQSKEGEIIFLKSEIERLSNVESPKVIEKARSRSTLKVIQDQNKLEDDQVLFKSLLDDLRLKNKIEEIVKGVELYNSAVYYASSDLVSKLKVNKIIDRNEKGKDSFTEKGNAFLKYYYDNF